MGKNSINDNPISDVEDDRLGFGEMAKHLAKAFLENDLSRGFVVGVEGTWGSGKSSLVNLALNDLNPKQVVRFSPWLVGNREDLLHQFFLDLSTTIHECLPPDIQEKTRKLMKRYSALALGTAKISDLLSMVGVPGTEMLTNVLELTGGKAEELSSASLGKLNLELRDNLKKLEDPVIVFIDDLDRLEPLEVVEVLRLVRAVADFPNVGYILAYDPENLASSLKSISINDGRAFLEKIVQASFRVPNAQFFDLRNWLAAEFHTLLEGEKLNPDEERRVSSVLRDWAGRYLVTPRDVVRTVNSLRLNFVPVRNQVDPGDSLFLELVHVHNDHLFQWIQRYVGFLSARADEHYLQDDSSAQFNAALLRVSGRKEHIPIGVELLDVSGIRETEAQKKFIGQLGDHLPGLNHLSWNTKDEYSPSYEFRDKNEVQKYTLGRRLASPLHYSLYFSFSYTAGHLSDEDITSFLDLVVADKDAATTKVVGWATQSRPQGGKMGEILLYRLVEHRPLITPEQISGLFEVLGQTMDELARNTNPASGYPDFLSGTRYQVFGLIEVAPKEQRMQILRHLLKTAKSLTWLSGIIWSFTQGEKSALAFADGNTILTEDEFSVLSDEFADRLAAEEPKKILNTPYFILLLYAWFQVGDQTRCVDFIKNITSTDNGFLDVLEKMASGSMSSHSEVQKRIQTLTLVDFFGSSVEPIERLKALAGDSKNKKLQQRANGVLVFIDEQK